MLILARNLLDNPEIAKSVATIIPILIDEFQDTNAIQYDIKKFVLYEDIPIEQQPYLFIVGDDKKAFIVSAMPMSVYSQPRRN